MNKPPPSPDGSIEEIAALVRTLHETEARLQELTQSGVDAVLFPSGHSYLLSDAQENLRRSEALLRIGGDIAQMGGWTVDLPEIRISWSEKVCAIHDLPPGTQVSFEEAISFYKPEYQALVRKTFEACAREGTPFDLEAEMVTAKGRLIWIRSIGEAMRDASGAIKRVQGAFQDITERRKAEHQFRLLETSVAHLTDLVIITEAEPLDEPGPRIVFVNDAFVKRTGYTRKEALGRSPRFLQGPETSRAALDQIRHALRQGEPVQVEVVNYTKAGEAFWLDIKIVPITNPAGQVTHYVAVERDITERKQAEAAMQESEERFAGAFLHAPIGMAVVSTTGGWLKVNRALCQLVGYSEIELLGRTFQDITHPDDLPTDLDNLRRILAGEIPTYQMEKRYFHKSGRIVTVLLNVSLVRDGRGQPLYFISQIQDITERKKSELKLRLNEQRFRSLVEATTSIVWDTPASGEFETEQPGWSAFTGQSFEELRGWGWLKAVHPDDQPETTRVWVAAVASKSIYEVEHRLQARDQTYHEMMVRAVPILAEDGTILQWIGVHTDISERKHAEKLLQASEERHRLMFQFNPLPLFVYDRETYQFLAVNQTAIDAYGYSEAEFLAMTIKDIRPVEDVPRLEQALDALEPGKKTLGVWRHRKKNGEIISVEISSDSIVFNGRQARLTLANDITERKKAELELSRTNRALQMLSNCNERLVRAEDEPELLKEICRVAVETGGYRMAWVGYAQDDEYKTIQPVAHAGKDDGYLSAITLSWSENETHGRGPAGRTIRGGQPVVCEDISDDLNFFTWRALAMEHGYKGVVCLPLRDGTRTFGLLVLYSAEIHKVDAGEIKLLQELADDLAFGIVNLRDRKQRRMAEAKIAEQAALLDATSDAIIHKDMDDRILFWNRGAQQIYGWTADEAIGKKSRQLLSGDPALFDKALKTLLEKKHWQGELPKRAKDGRMLTVEARWTLVCDPEGKPKSVLAINSDITERKKLEAQFRRVQRMESIGTLASGVAHDLNNMLAPITMSIQLLQDKVTDEEGRMLLDTMQASARHGADLVKQVLSFARGVEGQRVPINTGHLLREIQKIVRDTFPKNIEFILDPGREVWMVTGDPTQLHQVFMNLCVNARDAMPNGGKLTISLENVVVDEVYAGMNPESKHGAYVMVKVADTGSGIPHEIREKIFEPFFTTKEIGKGTGLGLSTSSAIIKSHEGFINLYSEMGKGTIFKIYLPAQTTAKATEKVATEKTHLPRGHGELILVVDDEEGIRTAARRTLERFGYRVLLAGNGAEAVSLYARHGDEIAAVLTDMAMPVMDGPSTIIALKVMNPKVKIIGSSGHASNGGVAKAVGAGVEHFIPKPYTAEIMLKVFAEVLKAKPQA